MGPPNIIFIVLDTLRADRVLVNYKNKSLTPTIEKLLNNSIFFEQCIANYTWTVPSHISMFTGLYQTQNELLSKNYNKVSNKIPILTEILKDMGYFTMCFTENPYISRPYGLTRGFDIIIENIKGLVQLVKNWIEKTNKILKLMYLLIYFLNFLNQKLEKRIKSRIFLKLWILIYYKLKNLNNLIIQKLFWKKILFENYSPIKNLDDFYETLKNEIDKKPFYLFFNIMATHSPYIPFKDTFKYFGISIKDFKTIQSFFLNPIISLLTLNVRHRHLSVEKAKIIKKLYNACSFCSDLIVNNILSNLKNLGLIENSFVIITSDHGELLCDQFDHYLWNHNVFQSIYESLIRVPLIIYNPNLIKKTVKNQVELKDLFHTILHLTGIPKEKNKYLNIEKSLINQIKTNSTPEYIFGDHKNVKETILAQLKYQIPNSNNLIYSLRTNSHKYIKFHDKNEEFYDLLKDPYEQFNNADKKNEIYRRMKLHMQKCINKVNNTKELEDIITQKEIDLIKKNISRINIKKI